MPNVAVNKASLLSANLTSFAVLAEHTIAPVPELSCTDFLLVAFQQSNRASCKVPVFSTLNSDFLQAAMGAYSDPTVIDHIRLGFPINVNGEPI